MDLDMNLDSSDGCVGSSDLQRFTLCTFILTLQKSLVKYQEERFKIHFRAQQFE